MVDSIPMPTGPPSIIMASLPLRSSATCAASVGLGLPDVLARGAAIRQPLLLIRSSAIGSVSYTHLDVYKRQAYNDTYC